MNSEEVGFDPTIRWRPRSNPAEQTVANGEETVYDPTLAATMANPSFPYIRCDQDNFILHPEPIHRRKAIVSRGSLLWKAKKPTDNDWNYVVKTSGGTLTAGAKAKF